MKRNGLLALAVLGALAAPGMALAAKVNLSVWIPWGGDRISAFTKVAAMYEQKHPGVRLTFATGDYTKFLTACAAGSPPDIMTVGGPELSEYVEKKLLTSLKSYYSASNLPLDDFFYPGRHQLIYKGEPWAMPFETNPCFALWWNKTQFSETGLDPNRPPETLEELELYNGKLTQKSPDGSKFTRYGYALPAGTYDYANSLFNLSWIFGGSLYDETKQVFTIDEPRNVKALQWWVDLCKRYDFAGKINGLDNMVNGKLSMGPVVPNLVDQAMEVKKDLKWGMTGMQPYPTDGGVKGVTWDGGWTMSIPRSAKHKSDSWNFIKWFLTSDESSIAIYKSTGVLVGYSKAGVFTTLAKDEPTWGKIAVEMLTNSRIGRPVSPACNFMMTTAAAMVPQALTMKKEPKAMLTELNTLVNKELDKWKKRAAR